MRPLLRVAGVTAPLIAAALVACHESSAVAPPMHAYNSPRGNLVTPQFCAETDPTCVNGSPTPPPPPPPNLAVSIPISGSHWVQTPGGTMTFTASVSNSSSAHHYFYWLQRDCWSDEQSCEVDFQLVGQGEDLSQITLTFGTLLAWKDVEVQVKDYPMMVYSTGASDTVRVAGPALKQTYPTLPVGCGAGPFYPFDEFKWTDSAGYVPTGKHYRWDPCTNKKIFNPDST